MTAELNWWQKPLAILGNHYDFGQPGAARRPTIEPDPATIEKMVRWKRRSGFELEFLMLNHSYLEGEGGEDPANTYYKNSHGYREDWLGKYLPVAQKHGLRVIVYFNCHWLKLSAFPRDYYVVDPAGKPKIIYGDGGEICCRGPYRAWSEQRAEELGRYPLDGVFLDGPVKDSCWCPHCRAAYQERYNRPLPDDPATLSPAQQAEYEEFLTEMPVGYMEAFARGLKKSNPAATLCCNGGDARQLKATAPFSEIVGEEGGFVGYGPINGEFPFHAGLSAKRLEARARGRGRVIFCDCGFKRSDWYIHPVGEVARMLAGSIANGASPWVTAYGSAEKVAGTQTIFRFNRLIRDFRGPLTNGESLAEAAILDSPLNQQLAGAARPTSGDDVHKRDDSARRLAVPKHHEEFLGLYAAMARSGYPFDVVDEDTLLEGALPARIKLLILPGVGAMSDAVAEKVRRFVAAGGRVLATFDTSLFDERGVRRPTYALADLFGADPRGELIGPSDLDYMGLPPKGRADLAPGVSQDLLPCPEYWQLVNRSAVTKSLLYYREKMARRYASLPPLSNQPAALLNRFGKGQAIFIPSTIGQLSLRYRFPDIRVLLRNAANVLAKPPVRVDGGDEFIETTLRRSADGGVTLHLINWASGERPSHRAIPLGPLKVSVRLPRGVKAGKTVLLAMSGKKVKAAVKANRVSFVVPRIEEYEMAVI